MKKLLEYLPFHFTLSLIIGITSQFNFRIWSFGFSKIVYAVLALFVLLLVLRRSRFYCVSVWLFFFFLGVTTVYLQNDRNYETYFARHGTDKATAILTIEKELKSNQYNYKYEASILKLDSVDVRGKVLLNVHKDTSASLLKVGDVLFLKPKILAISPPLNPHQFDYRSYLKKQGIRHQIFLKNSEYKILEQRQFSLQKWAWEIRSSIQSSLQKYVTDTDVYAIINALVLGQRHDISKDLMESYSRAGAIHILAVSGLHVGILLLIFSYLLKPLESIKRGKIYKAFIMVLLLWMFALIAGLSASVVRAVTMFTFVAIGMIANRPGGVLYGLMSSAFFLLLIKPLFLFDVGFQLSYLAVFGIVWIQPKLYKIWKPRYLIFDKLWQLSTVSIAAQLLVLPLSLYYFHQFPGLFIFSNLVIVPFLGMILIGGILIIVLSLFEMVPTFLIELYGMVINSMNSFVKWVAAQEQFLISEIPFSIGLMIASYGIILSIGNTWSKWHPQKIIMVLTSVLLFQGVLIVEKYEHDRKNSLIVFHKNRHTIIGQQFQDTLSVYSDIDGQHLSKLSELRSYALGEDVFMSSGQEIRNYFIFGNKEILIVDKKGIYEFRGYSNPTVVLRESPKINLERLIAILDPKVIIADGSNYKSIIAQWKKTCLKKKTPFWYTGQKGAYILKQ